MGVANDLCPVCKQGKASVYRDISLEVHQVKCLRCGDFKVTDDAVDELDATPGEQRYLLSAYCRRFPPGLSRPEIVPGSVPRIIRELSRFTPLEKFDCLLECIARSSPGPGEGSAFDANEDYPLLIARNPAEADFFLDELEKRDYVQRTTAGTLVTLKGWERLEEIKRTGHSSNRAFVAMWFDQKMDELYAKAIEPAILKAKYRPLRIDRHEHVNRIDDEIIGQIKRSRFMVADFTGQRHGVYFEAGLMMGLGRTVIWMCRQDELKGLHFDVRQFNFIDYESLEDAKTRLHHRILRIEGEGPGADEQA